MSPAQVTVLADGVVREVNATRTPLRQGRRRTQLARTEAREDAAKAAANRALHRESTAARVLAGVTRVVRAMPRWAEATITVLLMGASLVTLSTVLAVADVPPLEAWLLPAAFGPVFVLITKVLVGWVLVVTENKPKTSRRLARLLTVALLLGFVVVAAGVAVKSMVIGSYTPLAASDTMLSSAAMFGAVVLAEGIGAAALAAYQHAPGAREFEAARAEYRSSERSADRAVRAAFTAQGVRSGLEARLAVEQEWAAGRGALARAWARSKAVELAAPDDPILDLVAAEPMRLPAPVVGLLAVPQPVPEIPGRRFPDRSQDGTDIDAEFRRLLADRDRVNGQDPLW